MLTFHLLPTGSPLNASPPNVDNSRPQQEGQEEVARLVSSVLNGLGLPVNPQTATAPSANESANPQPPPASLNTSSVDSSDDGLYSSMPSITNSHTHTQPQPSREEGTARNENPSSLANSGILLSMSFDVERRRPMFTSFMGARDGNGQSIFEFRSAVLIGSLCYTRYGWFPTLYAIVLRRFICKFLAAHSGFKWRGRR